MALDPESPSVHRSHPLSAATSLSATQREALAAKWITTLEELVAAAASDTSKTALAEFLLLSSVQLDDVLAEARTVLGAEEFERLSCAKPGGPTGALLTDEQKRRFGLREEKS